MSILAMYYRIGSGMRALPWIVQARAVWIAAGFMSATALASFLVSDTLSWPKTTLTSNRHSC
jgi:hypothetical protein